jgi:hypothetical protein
MNRAQDMWPRRNNPRRRLANPKVAEISFMGMTGCSPLRDSSLLLADNLSFVVVDSDMNKVRKIRRMTDTEMIFIFMDSSCLRGECAL